ncbi:hypothetical protein KP509_24G080800 [Ceratopteris richardii]|uniref:Histone RNA hairpin-binding protein RNA-binding domain-containing protein n=1 Tax=Ceratopteris richardii TaxID=49495 RepID=A0A8T2RZI5_CERRI|nr:hypothetical protein KP509_24G080800 [Ceratopteris richardii]
MRFMKAQSPILDLLLPAEKTKSWAQEAEEEEAHERVRGEERRCAGIRSSSRWSGHGIRVDRYESGSDRRKCNEIEDPNKHGRTFNHVSQASRCTQRSSDRHRSADMRNGNRRIRSYAETPDKCVQSPYRLSNVKHSSREVQTFKYGHQTQYKIKELATTPPSEEWRSNSGFQKRSQIREFNDHRNAHGTSSRSLKFPSEVRNHSSTGIPSYGWNNVRSRTCSQERVGLIDASDLHLDLCRLNQAEMEVTVESDQMSPPSVIHTNSVNRKTEVMPSHVESNDVLSVDSESNTSQSSAGSPEKLMQVNVNGYADSNQEYEMLASLLLDDSLDIGHEFDVTDSYSESHFQNDACCSSIFGNDLELPFVKVELMSSAEMVMSSEGEMVPPTILTRARVENVELRHDACVNSKQGSSPSSGRGHGSAEILSRSRNARQQSRVFVDVTNTFEIEGSPAVKLSAEEVDVHRLSQRQRQIDYGKNTLGYERYCELVPRYRSCIEFCKLRIRIPFTTILMK